MTNELDITRIPDPIFLLMEELEELKPGAFMLAGGAPRDLILGADVTDWDFYADVSELGVLGDYALKLRQLLSKLGYVELVKQVSYLIYPNTEFDVTTWRHDLTDKHKVQLILVPLSGKALLETFDISTCQVGLTTKGELISTYQFDSAALYKFHTLYMRTYKSQQHVIHSLYSHLPRVLGKYPWQVFISYLDMDDRALRKMRGVDEPPF